MSTVLGDTKNELAADLTTLLGVHLPGETVKVLPFEPTSVPNEQLTVTVVGSNITPDLVTLTVTVYCPAADPADGQSRQEAVVSSIADELPARWLDPAWSFGWDDRLQLFVARATIATPRGLGS